MQIEAELEVREDIGTDWGVWPQLDDLLLVLHCKGQLRDEFLNRLIVMFKLESVEFFLDCLIDSSLEVVRCNHINHLHPDSIFNGLIGHLLLSHHCWHETSRHKSDG